jgi:hypothetical protein
MRRLAYVKASLGPNDGDYRARLMLDELGLRCEDRRTSRAARRGASLAENPR